MDFLRTQICKVEDFKPQDQDSKFIIEGTLGQGGMGTIYDAFDRNIRRKVAIKSINSETAQNSFSRKYFFKEAQITGQLEHPNIIPVYEMSENSQGLLYYVMKRVQGLTLADILNKIKNGSSEYTQNYNLGALLSIFHKVCDAMAYAHARGVVHLDLKPENIMVGEFGEVLIVDWGIARLRRRSSNCKSGMFVTLDEAVNFGEDFENEQVVGTPAFMAPEQASGKSKYVGTRSDIYALGAILYNILTLRPPAAGKTTTVVLKKIIQGRVKDPLSFNEPNNRPDEQQVHLNHLPNGKVPSPIAKICTKAMNESLNDRYQSVTELQMDLNAYFSGYMTSVESGALFRKAQLYFIRNKYFVVIALLLILINLTVILLILL